MISNFTKIRKLWVFSSVLVVALTVIVYTNRSYLARIRYTYLVGHLMDTVDCESEHYSNYYQGSYPPDLVPFIREYENRHLKQSGDKSDPVSDQNRVIPNIVHYVSYTERPKQLKFHEMLSFKSVDQFVKPDYIFLHTNHEPTGRYWDEVKDIASLRIIRRNMTRCLYGQRLGTAFFVTSGSNVDRLVVLSQMGGIYLDFDMLVVRSLDALRQYPCTLGLEEREPRRFCGAAIICHKDSPFLKMWLSAYLTDYRALVWAYNTGTVPVKLSEKHPHLLHVEETTLMRPNGRHYRQIWGDQEYPWWENYAVHLYYRMYQAKDPNPVEPDYDNIKTWNSTFGAIARNILYGSYELISENLDAVKELGYPKEANGAR